MGAWIVVVAFHSHAGQAYAVGAVVVRGARIAIITASLCTTVHAPHRGVAEIVSTQIGVGAVEGRSRYAQAFRTNIVGGTYVAVVAHGSIVHVKASVAGYADVGSADVGVIAGCGDAGEALTALALVPDGAGVAVVASVAIVVGET